ncbi:hypothetical protein BCR42DRAFT_473675 [Absidia repens]|uniref:Uncharacterized protein n=1 Tax=Absidia repens TaxID=90262 RepID=A0A1X2HZU4_9FUNG|nr:hypothetical protein BCR42DRAFT_473675 [Absidia repens]
MVQASSFLLLLAFSAVMIQGAPLAARSKEHHTEEKPPTEESKLQLQGVYSQDICPSKNYCYEDIVKPICKPVFKYLMVVKVDVNLVNLRHSFENKMGWNWFSSNAYHQASGFGATLPFAEQGAPPPPPLGTGNTRAGSSGSSATLPSCMDPQNPQPAAGSPPAQQGLPSGLVVDQGPFGLIPTPEPPSSAPPP